MSVTYEYKCTQPDLPSNAKSPVMDSRQMTDWLNDMASKGWHFVGYGQKQWSSGFVQDWWVFRREKQT